MHESEINIYARVAVILTAAVILRWTYVILFYYTTGGHGDFGASWEESRIAASITKGGGFSAAIPGTGDQPTAVATPIYPYLLSIFYKVFGPFSHKAVLCAALTNGLIDASAIIPIFIVARKLAGYEAGILAAALYAIEPTSIWLTRFAWDSTLITAASAYVLLLYDWATKEPSRSRSFMFGLFIGVTALIKSVILAVTPVIIYMIARHTKIPIRKAMGNAALLLLGIALAIMPWVIRNATVMNIYTLQSNLGQELMVGNNPLTYNALIKGDPYPITKVHPFKRGNDENLLYARYGEKKYMEYAMKRAVRYIYSNPYKFVQLMGIRIKQFWLQDGKDRINEIRNIPFVVLVMITLLGVALLRARWRDILLPMSFLVFIPIIYYLTHVVAVDRYRAPIIPSIVILASITMVTVFKRLLKRS